MQAGWGDPSGFFCAQRNIEFKFLQIIFSTVSFQKD